MKKVISLITILIIATFSIITISIATTAVTPEYDTTFNGGKGIFYANGNSITINKDSNGDTIVYWNGGQQKVESTTTIIGGGKAGTNFTQSNIVMEDGTVALIYGGGSSLASDNLAGVDTSNVTINNGTILETVYGGGMIFSKVKNSNLTVNGGNIKAVCGGGAASVTINGVSYAAGTEADILNSKNRVDTANVTINRGKFDSVSMTSGIIFGGGQGYSYVGTSNLVINGGDMSNAYVTSGGSNGYTGIANTKITGGNINVFQTVNRGSMEKATVRIDGGSITTAYIGGENDSTVTGTINNVDFAVLSGNIENFLPGISASTPIIVEQNSYKAVLVKGTVTNSGIGESEVKIQYDFQIIEDFLKIEKGKTLTIQTQLVTTPTGYEKLFEDEKISWSSSDEKIAIINENGVLTAANLGNATITGQLLNSQDIVQIEIQENLALVLAILIITIVGVAAIVYFIVQSENSVI